MCRVITYLPIPRLLPGESLTLIQWLYWNRATIFEIGPKPNILLLSWSMSSSCLCRPLCVDNDHHAPTHLPSPTAKLYCWSASERLPSCRNFFPSSRYFCASPLFPKTPRKWTWSVVYTRSFLPDKLRWRLKNNTRKAFNSSRVLECSIDSMYTSVVVPRSSACVRPRLAVDEYDWTNGYRGDRLWR